MKAYTHPVKVAAGCMVGKALSELLIDNKNLSESAVERMGDNELLYFLRDSSKPIAKSLADGVLQRHLYKPIYCARALEQAQCNLNQYEVRQSHLNGLGLTDPKTRTDIEAKMARQAGLKPVDVIVYCPPKAPGLQKVRQYVETQPGREEVRDAVCDPHVRIYSAHLRLWTVYVFVRPSIEQNTRNKVCQLFEDLIGLKNQIQFHRHQLLLDL